RASRGNYDFSGRQLSAHGCGKSLSAVLWCTAGGSVLAGFAFRGSDLAYLLVTFSRKLRLTYLFAAVLCAFRNHPAPRCHRAVGRLPVLPDGRSDAGRTQHRSALGECLQQVAVPLSRSGDSASVVALPVFLFRSAMELGN